MLLRFIKRMRVMQLDRQEAKLRAAHLQEMGKPGATDVWTADALYRHAAPLRRIQLERAALLKELDD